MSTQYQAGYKLRDLKAFLSELLGKKVAKQMDCEMSNVSLILATKHMGHGFDLMHQQYTAEFYFERFPYKECDPAVLFANVAAWLMDNDSERDDFEELTAPEIDVVLEDEASAEILITIDFDEPVKIVADENGGIYWNAQRWRIEEYEVYTAEKYQLDIKRD